MEIKEITEDEFIKQFTVDIFLIDKWKQEDLAGWIIELAKDVYWRGYRKIK